jgi:signal transduction histidine kinase
VVKRFFGSAKPRAEDADTRRLDAERAHALVEESRELVLVLDESDRIVAASRRAREALEGVVEGAPMPPGIERTMSSLRIPYQAGGERETLVYVAYGREVAAYEELRAGFTAAVSHELRTPLARLMALLESAELAGSDPRTLVEQARKEVERMRELIDDVLFLSELESGREVVALGGTRALPVLEGVLESLAEKAERAAVALRLECSASVDLPLRQRMVEIVAKNLAENAIRYAGRGATFTLAVESSAGEVRLVGRDDGVGIASADLPRIFERFYRADPARASEGSGLGLAIVKHVVTAAGGLVEASAGPGGGLQVTCRFTTS